MSAEFGITETLVGLVITFFLIGAIYALRRNIPRDRKLARFSLLATMLAGCGLIYALAVKLI